MALLGEDVDLDSLGNAAAIVLEMVRPNLDAARRKAEGGKNANGSEAAKNGRKIKEELPEPKRKIPEELPESCENKNKNKDKNKEKNKDNSQMAAAFEMFWEAYPRKENRQKAFEVFGRVNVPVMVLLEAVRQQQGSDQWNREGGRFIPSPARWLEEKRWQDRLTQNTAIPKGASGQLGTAELEAIEAMMANKRAREGGR